MLFSKKYLPVFTLLFLLICSFSFNTYAGFDLDKGLKESGKAAYVFTLNFIHNNYLISSILFCLAILTTNYGVKTMVNIDLSRFAVLVAIVGVITFTIIKLFY